MHQIFRFVVLSLALLQFGFIAAVPHTMAATNIGTNITTNGTLTVDGALKFINGAVNDYILKTDGSGNATWTPVGTALGNATADDLPAGVVNTYYDPTREGAPNGLATLDAGGQIPSGQIPALAINNTYVVATIAARDALSPNKGDVAIVTDAGTGESRSYIWDGASWIELLTPLQLYLARSNNLSDLTNTTSARTNLGLGTADSPVFTGLTLSGLTSGSLLFGGAGGVVSQDNTNLFWDDSSKFLGIGTTTPGSKLDVKGELRLSGATSGYVGFVPAAVAGSTTYTLPAADGSAGYILSTNGAGVLSWSDAAGKFQRVGTTLSPNVAGDDITTSGDIYTTGTGGITSAGLLVADGGITANAGDLNLNAIGAFDTNISTGGATGSVNIGNPSAAAIAMVSGGSLTLTGGAASTWGTSTGDITLQPGGAAATGLVNIGGVASATPDLLALDVKSVISGAGDPASGVNGAMYYNGFSNKFRCYTNGSWGDCDTTGGTATLQSAYNSGATITTGSSTDIALTLTSGNFTAAGAGSVNLTPTGASSFTSGGALTLTGGTASTWGTATGDLSLQAAGTGTTANINVGAGGAGSTTPDLLALDVKSDAGDPAGANGAMYYNGSSGLFRCFEAGSWKNCGATGGAGGESLQQTYNIGGTITTAGTLPIAFTLTSGDFNVTGAGAVNLTPTGASSFTSGGALTFTGGAASTWGTSAGNLSLQAAGSGSTANVQIGTGGAGSTTPDLFAVDVKSDAGDPAGFAGAMYYNANGNRFRCYENGAWKDCDAGVVASFQTAYNNGGLVTTSGGNPIAFTLTAGDFTAAGAGSVNLTPTGSSSLTSGGALTLTGGAASTWSTSAGALTVDSAAALNLGTTNATSVNIGRTGGGAINLTAPSGVNLNPYGAAAGNTTGLRFLELTANGSEYFAFKAPDALTANNTYVLPTAYPGVSGYSLTSDTSGNLSWTNAGGVLPGWTDNGTTVNLTTSTDNVLAGAAGAATAKLEVTSSDANALRINPYGAAAGQTGNLQFMELATNGTNYVGFKAPDNIAANSVWSLPSADGTSGQVLTTNGSGNLTWTTTAGASASDYLFGYDTTDQAVVTAGTFQTITFNTPTAVASGWTYSAGDFTVPATGLYRVDYNASVGRDNNGDTTVTIRATKGGAEISGSAFSSSPSRANRPISMNNSFIVSLAASDLLRFELTSTNAANSIGLFSVAGAATTQPRMTVSITRIN